MNARRYFFGQAVLILLLLVWQCAPTCAQTPEPFRPIIFVPGILGSELIDQKGELVWGGVKSFKRFSELEIGQSGSLQLRVGGPIRTISILGPFWTMHQYDGLLKTLGGLNYREGENLFVFPYDWRQSNFETAEKLQAFIDAQAALRGREFDIIAHSMGGIVARIYIQTLGGGSRVKRLITLGTPAQGAMSTFATMSEGWGEFKNYMAGGINTIRRVIFSFPSIYELLPSYDKCCRIGDEDNYADFDPTELSIWKLNNWLPSEYDTARIASVEKSFGNARRLRALMREPLPPNVEVTAIAGDRFGTYLYLYVDPSDRSWRKWRFSTSRGDGTVPVWSAANWSASGEGLGDSMPAFVDHGTIFEDKWIINLLQRKLNKFSGPPPISGRTIPIAVTKSGNSVEVSLVEARFDPPIIFSGATGQLTITISASDEVQRDDFVPAVSLLGPSGEQGLKVNEATSDSDLRQRRLRFNGSVRFGEAGAHSAQIGIPGVGTYTRDILVLE